MARPVARRYLPVVVAFVTLVVMPRIATAQNESQGRETYGAVP